jgi:hypothetical protein
MRGYQSHYRPVTTQKVTVSGSSAAVASGFGNYVQVVRVVADAACHVALGTNPTATVNDMLLPANAAEYFSVSPGEKLAFLQASTGGNAYVTEMSQ